MTEIERQALDALVASHRALAADHESKVSMNYRQWGLLLAATAQDDGWAEVNDQYLAAQRMWEDATDRAISAMGVKSA